MRKKILVVIAIAYLIVTFVSIPDGPQTTNDRTDFLSIANAPLDVSNLIRSACYDCHSHETHYPMYAYLPPISNWVQGHVRHGKGKLNLSEWDLYSESEQQELLQVFIDEVENGEMPPSNYEAMHKEAIWNNQDRAMVLDFVRRLKED